MSNTKISALPAGAPAQSTDLIPAARSGSNVSLRVQDLQSNAFDNVGLAGFRDDFLAFNVLTVNATAAAFTSDTFWMARNAGGGGTTHSITAGGQPFSNPGAVILVTTAVSGQGLAIYKTTGAQPMFGNLGSNAGWQADFIFNLGTVGASTLCARVGFVTTNEQFVDPPTDGFWVEYDSANSSSNTDFTWVTAQSNTQTYATTNSIPADNKLHHFRIRSTMAGQIGFTVDGGTEYLTTTTVSTVTEMMPVMQVLARTNSAERINVDFFSYFAVTGRT